MLSLLLVALPETAFVFSLPFPKKLFALVGCEELGSVLVWEVGSTLGFVCTDGIEAGAGGGRRFVRRLTAWLVIVP